MIVASVKVEHEGESFELPMTFDEASSRFGLTAISQRMAVRYNERGWLEVKVVKNVPWESRLLGINFYYDDTIKVKTAMRSIEQKFGKRFRSGNGIYLKRTLPWWSMRINDEVVILVYPHLNYRPISYMSGELDHAGKGQGRQWVIAYTDRIEPQFGERTNFYIGMDGTVIVTPD